MKADFSALIVDLKNGQALLEINAKFNEFIESVVNTAAKGKFTLELTAEPAKMGMGGVVLELSVTPEVKMKKPEFAIGSSTFFVTKDGALTRDDPRAMEMFNASSTVEQRKQ